MDVAVKMITRRVLHIQM